MISMRLSNSITRLDLFGALPLEVAPHHRHHLALLLLPYLTTYLPIWTVTPTEVRCLPKLTKAKISPEVSQLVLMSCFFNEFVNKIPDLKKVTSEMQTHKNPALRQGPAPFKAPSNTPGYGGQPAAAIDKPPSFQREGKKWLIVSVQQFEISRCTKCLLKLVSQYITLY